ncbi:hypothetical protein SRRS_45590 [Sporomusa rhizae]|uniref:methyl-accepting chemotaxis protein n=1 Tax=Sporomusa rhizae TaxID=357999 RepID=UPI00352A22E4
MQWLANLKMAYKLGVLMLIALIALGFVGASGYYYLKEANRSLDVLYDDRLIPVKLLNESRSNVNSMNSAVLELMLTTDVKKNKELRDFIEQRTKQVGDNLEAVANVHLDAKAKELLDKVTVSRQKYRDVRGQVIELALQNKNAEAYTLYTTQVDPLTKEFTDNLRNLANYFSDVSKQSNLDNDAQFAHATWISIGIIIAAFLTLGGSGWLITNAITRPLGYMVMICEEFAAGDFRERQRQVLRKDEIGQLADALVKMQGNVRSLMKQITESAEQVAASSEELTASSEQSAQAANQVATAITGVANGASEQLAATNQTSVVVEQMSAGIQQVAANTNHVAEQSARTADKAQEAAGLLTKR